MRINDSIFLGAIVPELDNGTLVIQQNKRILFLSLLSRLIEVVVRGVPPLSLPDAIADSLAYLKAFGGTEQRNIPAEYTQVEYIESTGTQYIDTGYKSSNNTKVQLQLLCPEYSTFVFGSRNGIGGDAQKRFGLFFAAQWNPQYANQNGIGSPAQTGTIYNIEMSQDGLYVNGALSASFASEAFSGDYNMYLFANNTADTTIGYGTARIYVFKIYDNGTLVRNFIPARRNSDNVLGMYDTVTGTFFTNAGTGTFTAGGEAVPTPDRPIDIVCNNGVVKAFKTLNISTYDTSASDAGIDITFEGVTDRRKWSALNDGGTGTKHYENGFVSIYMDTAGNRYYTKALVDGVVYNGSVYNTGEQIDTWNFNIVKNIDIYCPTINTDGTVETINVHGKNLYNDATKVDGYYISATGVIVTATGASYSALIPVKPNTTYVFSGVNGATVAANKRLHAYDSNGVWLEQLNFVNNIENNRPFAVTATTTAQTAYVRMSFAASDTNIQIEQGSTATTYEPYYNGGTATAEMLLKVGDYQDVQSILDGAVTRNVGVKVLDGTENWAGVAHYFMLALPDMLEEAFQPGFCTHFVIRPYGGAGDIQLGSTAPMTYWFEVSNKPSGVTDLASWKQWLADQYAAGTPVIVIYPLATPTTESVAGQTMQVQAGDNYLEITQASLDNLELEAKYQAAVSLTIQEVQDANLDPNVQVTIN